MTRRRRLFEVCLIAGGCMVAVLVAWSTNGSGDYMPGGLSIGDSNPAPAIWALVQGHLSDYIAQQPLMGAVSILLRAPAAAIGHGNSAHPLLEYRLGVVLCLVPGAFLAAWLSRLSSARAWKAMCAVTCVLLIVGPSNLSTIGSGHPEEVLTAVLAVASVIAAQRGHEWWAGIWLGLAIGTKPWALLAAVPVLAALPAGRWRAILAAAALGGAAGFAALIDPSAFLARSRTLGSVNLINPYSLWWPVGSGLRGVLLPVRVLPFGLTRTTVLLLATGTAASAALACRMRWGASKLTSPLALLAALWLVRALADPHPGEYYYVPFLVATAIYEMYSLRRLPVVAVLAAELLTVTYALPFKHPAVPNTVLLVWTVALGAYLARSAFGRLRVWPRFVQPLQGYFNWLRAPVDLRTDDA